jgi:hypothetical protein
LKDNHKKEGKTQQKDEVRVNREPCEKNGLNHTKKRFRKVEETKNESGRGVSGCLWRVCLGECDRQEGDQRRNDQYLDLPVTCQLCLAKALIDPSSTLVLLEIFGSPRSDMTNVWHYAGI